MSRLAIIKPESATGKAKELLDGIQAKAGMTPNIYRALANSPAALEGLSSFGGALGKGVLSPKLREQIALVVGETNECNYCLAAHSTIGKSLGLSEDAVLDSRRGVSPEPKTEAVLAFAKSIVENRGHVSDADLERVGAAGYDDGAIVEIFAVVVLNIFTNYFNHIAETPIDFPEAPALTAV